MAKQNAPKSAARRKVDDTIAKLAKDGYDEAHVDLSPHLAVEVEVDGETVTVEGRNRTADMIGVKGPDSEQWGDAARKSRGAAGGAEPPGHDLLR